LSSSESFYWHDYETSGADPATDRPMQFAGVRTDANLEVIGEPLVIYSRPTPDYLPHPGAIRVTGISPYTALEQGLPEHDFIGKIHAELSAPGTCGVGYNSIRFDDEITRFTLYRNFFDAYDRERNHGRSRWDLIDVARAFYALRPEGIQWPTREDGLPSFRLEDLTATNGIDHGSAHDALSDVMATIGLARLLRGANAALFDNLFAHRARDALVPLLDLQSMKPVLHVSGMFGAERGNLAAVVPLALHPKIKTEVICADLSQAPDFLEQSVEAIQAVLFAKREELPEGAVRPPLKTIRLNRAPVLLPMEWAKDGPAERWGLKGEVLRDHLARYRDARNANPQGFTQKIQSIYEGRAFPPRTDPDSMLYDGFFDWPDKNLFPAIREATPDALAQRSWVFKDKRLPELLFRYRARNYPDSLSPDEQNQWRAHCQHQLTDSEFNLAAFDAEFAAVTADPDLSEQQQSALADLSRYRDELAEFLELAE
jgi:exodeoxyribonuclease-1